ncbi:MAG: sigma-54-dependent Fis family transcriptional regulator [Planctomycetota bacterium]
MNQTTWMKWEQVPWLSRSELAGSLLRLCDRLLELAVAAENSAVFLRDELPDIANEFSVQWAGVMKRTPEWKVVTEFGRRSIPELPYQFLSESLDRDATGLYAMEAVGNTLMSIPLPKSGTAGQALVLVGKSLTADLLPHAVVTGRILSTGLRATQERARGTQRISQLKATLKIASHFATAPDSRSLLELIAQEATRLLGTDRASIFIWDKEQKELVACPALGVEGGELRLPDHLGIVGEVVQTGRAIRVDDAYNDSRFNKDVDVKTGYKTRNLLCVPLLDGKEKRIGAFEVINRKEGDFNDDDEDTLKELGIQAAIALQNTQEREHLSRRHRQLTDQVTQGVRIVGESQAVRAIRDTIGRLATNDLAVLIVGESGTGKEVVAQSLHYQGSRREQPFIAVNCAAMPDSLLESELFGHERGAFTDARETRHGKFEAANGGTLFLDEIGDMSPNGQAKLLRVLEQKVITRVGGTQNITVNVRVVAATNANLADAIRAKKFREDLYYRLNVVKLNLPPLRDRPEDILLLADHFLQSFCRQANRRPLLMSTEARQRLQSHNWPGNIRELRNLMERIAFLCTGERVEVEDLAFMLSPEKESESSMMMNSPLSDATDEFQREYIRKAIERVSENMSEAAKVLGLHRSNLYRKMRQLGMDEGKDEKK